MSKKLLTGILGNTILVVAGIMMGALFAEGVVRLVYSPPQKEMDFFRLKSSEYYYAHQEVGWLPRPNVYGKHEQAGSFSTTFRTNSHGLRDREYSFEKPDGRMRILALGDSFTWGWGVNDGEIYTEVLESLLHGVDVINLGVTAFNLAQEYKYLKLEGMRYRPDVVVLALCMNDFDDVSIPTATSQPTGQQVHSDGESWGMRAKMFGATHSVLYWFIVDRINSSKSLARLFVRIGLKGELGGYEELDTNLRPAIKEYPSGLQVSWKKVLTLIQEMNQFLRERNARLILAPIPSVQSVDEKVLTHSLAYSKFDPGDFDLDKPYRMLEDFAHRNGITFVDVMASFRDTQRRGIPLFLTRDIHFNREGHRLFAEALASVVAQMSPAAAGR
jgi:lysophospholipase L1-like esterase